MYHCPQVLAYLGGNFKYWNPKVTTPPGLYFFTLPILWCSGKVFPSAWKLPLMRAVNAAVLPLLHRMLVVCGANADWIVLNSFIFPYFFLYYTDVLSLLFVVVAWWLGNVKHFHALSAAVGAISLAFRQTNVVWIGFVGGLEAVNAYCCSGTGGIWKVLVIGLQYGLVLLGFGAFVWWNGGSVVLGDKSAHALTLNVHQLTFWSLYSLALEPSLVLQWLESFNATAYFSLVLGFFSHCLVFPLVLHPYNLQKNCHLLYFVFAWLKANPAAWWIVCGLVTPIPLLVQWRALGSGWKRFFFFSSLLASTCFSSLVEVRYFAVPWTVLALVTEQRKSTRSWKICTINALLMTILLFKKYIW